MAVSVVIGVFIAALFVDIAWTKYIIASAALNRWRGAIWSTFISLLVGVNIGAIALSLWYVIPSAIGGTIGTFLAIDHEARSAKKAQVLALEAEQSNNVQSDGSDIHFMRIVRKNPRYSEQ